MKEVLKEYWWIALIIIAAPIVFNFMALIPAFTPLAGGIKDWVAFWGGYLSAIISAMVAFIILIIQRKDNQRERIQDNFENQVQQFKNRSENRRENSRNREENRRENSKNRQLQINAIKYQQQSLWLNSLMKAMIDNFMVYQTDNLREIIELARYSNLMMAQSKIKELFNKLTYTDSTVAMLMPTEQMQDETLKAYNKERLRIYDSYYIIVRDLQVLLIIFFTHVTIENVKKEEKIIDSASDNLKLKLNSLTLNETLSFEQVINISDSLIAPASVLFDEIRQAALSCIKEEKEKINSIISEKDNGTR